jgi:hypothetical protein
MFLVVNESEKQDLFIEQMQFFESGFLLHEFFPNFWTSVAGLQSKATIKAKNLG